MPICSSRRVPPLFRFLALLAAVLVVCAAGGLSGAEQSAPPQQPASPQQSAPPEQAAPQQPTFRAKVELVRVDVSVTGRDDEPIADLKSDEFQVRQRATRRAGKRSS